MDVYYHVVSIEKKKCKFNFSLIKNEKTSVFGSVAVDLLTPGAVPSFDNESGAVLDDREKQFVISRVLRYVYTDSIK